ncbi:Mitochondrial succinate-fumarate transporter [Basidiobolus ranarum]|uniref:Mitochondrial succinate-fumarate transporter n=1 Tax=Basidiobolus ranarum TaxID=34480 RepID=A0ABR2WN13_9FUNG
MSKDHKKRSIFTYLIAGGSAGFIEACIWYPLDTIKVRMQLITKSLTPGQPRGFVGVGIRIILKEGALASYKELGAVVSGIVPKMAIRFSSFEIYRSLNCQSLYWIHFPMLALGLA